MVSQFLSFVSLVLNYLLQDIRNFFGAKPKAGNAVKEEKVMPKKRPKPVVLSSSSEDEEEKVKKVQEKKKPVKTSPAKKAAVKHALSDSGMDFSYFSHP